MHMNEWEEKHYRTNWWEMRAANCLNCLVFTVITKVQQLMWKSY